MLAVFKSDVLQAPKELHSPASLHPFGRVKTPKEALKDLLASNPSNGCSVSFSDKVMLGYVPSEASAAAAQQRIFCGMDEVYCMFLGSLTNLCSLNKQYGLTKGGNDATFVMEAYRTLRDRNPIPAHQVLRELEGSFGFVIFDHKSKNVFVALVSTVYPIDISSSSFQMGNSKPILFWQGADNEVSLYWGIAADGSVMISDNSSLIKASCRKSFAPFPPGCMYHSERGLISFEHPTYKMKAMPRIDSEGAMCGSYFALDVYSKVNSMPRVGSQANWATWE
ncbi:stem-specific protein TSJT1-like [Andrographis paniculata]|uniref:stem-specific protein TSJT1-like n=1 Tax=Andrographis paniculata TaxID=175694 RepID=UPI0021E7608D|nr:stem-specific protein TSJT1-like [Andrographis paniculata]